MRGAGADWWRKLATATTSRRGEPAGSEVGNGSTTTVTPTRRRVRGRDSPPPRTGGTATRTSTPTATTYPDRAVCHRWASSSPGLLRRTPANVTRTPIDLQPSRRVLRNLIETKTIRSTRGSVPFITAPTSPVTGNPNSQPSLPLIPGSSEHRRCDDTDHATVVRDFS